MMSAVPGAAVVTLDVGGDGVAHLRIDAPPGNAISPAVVGALNEQAVALAQRDDVRVVVLATAGRTFCVGGDIGHFAAAADPLATVRELAAEFHAALLALAELDAPIVTRVQGAAAGGGLSLALAGDLVIAGASASFSAAYTRIGLSPDGGMSWRLPRLVGAGRAAELMLTNRRVSAEEAERISLVSQVVPDEELDARVGALAAALADGPAPAQAAVRRLLASSATATFEEQLEREAESIARLAASPQGREGVAAFLEKRPPDFRGA
jgi:2-(1,2-epoxy-1,2-dihydrophenyl)acetyl-CoA isomerase